MKFYCPFCDEDLSVLDNTLVRMNGTLMSDMFSVTTTFHLPAELGKYGYRVEGEIVLKEGACVDFGCHNPDCGRSFTTHYNDDLSEIKMVDDNGIEEYVAFFRIFGKRGTFVLDRRMNIILKSFGDEALDFLKEAEKSINFFGE